MSVAYPASIRRPGALQAFFERPEFPALCIIAATWVVLVLSGAVGSHSAGSSSMPGMPGMAMPRSSSGPDNDPIGGQLLGWVQMTVAMMGPSALAGIRHTGLNSLRWRRNRAMSEYAIAYLGVWVIFGVVALVLAHSIGGARSWVGLGVVLVAAAVWELLPAKRRFLRACHRARPLPPKGRAAELGSMRFGLRSGLACLGSCWCVMLVMIAAPAAHLAWMVGLTVLVTSERFLERPRRAVEVGATVLAMAALGALAVAAI
jgi:predicted metal-binding membrane protein